MTQEQLKVKEFHRLFGHTINLSPKCPSPEDRELRHRLIIEELQELIEAKSIVGVADALGDLLYVVYGTAISFGIDMEPVFNEIHRSNMTKLWPDGESRKDKHGKTIKPPNYSPADLKKEILQQSGNL
ncbi:MAG: nucleoside triphosphate pyrophosphohydrolase family protein [Verrucomicrobia bacterium]|jgi:predicted HAD superfamily Cof-like phosphohydrolase|nr:nucleoside triphosphate pyrophosphohydrolase family protein [Verrucomicrobiota bacterium]